MTTRGWNALALFGGVVLAGCYGTSQAKDGQSHWQTCTQHSDCEQPEYECVDHECVAVVEHVAPERDSGRPSSVEGEPPIQRVDAQAPWCGEACTGMDPLPDPTPPPLAGTRVPCNPDMTCPDGLVCHIDRTCIERGVADENGLATIALNIPLPFGIHESTSYEQGGFVVTDDAVFWQDMGATSAVGEHQVNGGIYRFDLASREVTTVVDSLGEQRRGLVVDGDYAYFQDDMMIRYVGIDGQSGGGLIRHNITGEHDAPWTVVAGSVYYTHFHGVELRRMTPATGEDGVVFEVDDGHAIISLASNDQHVFMETHEFGLPTTRLLALEGSGSTAEVISSTFRIPDAPGQIIVTDDFIFSVEGNHTALRAHDLATGEWSTVGETAEPWMKLRSVHDDFVYYTLDQDLADIDFRYSIVRSRVGEEAEVLRETHWDLGGVVEHAGYIYWLEQIWLMRKAL